MTTYAIDTYNGDGSETDFTISFDYFEADDVIVKVDNVTKTVTTDYSIVDTTTVRFVTAPANSTSVTIERSTDIDNKKVTFSDGGTIRAVDMNNQNDQLLYAVQEAADDVTNALRTNGTFYDAGSDKISNVADPTSAQDAATKNYVDTSATSQVSQAAASATSAAASATTATTKASEASTSATNASNYKDDAKKIADTAEDTQYTLSDGTTQGYSALHYKEKADEAKDAAVVAQTAAETAEANAETAEDNAEDWATKTTGAVSGDYSSKAWSVGGTGVTDTASRGAAKEWATKAEDSTVDGTEYSAKHYSAKASGHSTTASGHADTAQDWAVKTDGEAESGEGYSSKAWSVGGTGVTDTAGSGASKEWATETTSTVDGTEYSAKEYAIGTQRRGQANGGSAKDWATYTAGTVDGTVYSAKYYAEQAAANFDNFDDRYLGAKSSAPTVDNDGNALVNGALYYNSTNSKLNVYDTGTSQWSAIEVGATNGFAIAMAIAL